MDAHIRACVRGQVMTSARFLSRTPIKLHSSAPRKEEKKAGVRDAVCTHSRQWTQAKSALQVLTSRDLLCMIATFQDGLFPSLLPVFTSGHWMSTFAANEFVAMHLGPHGRLREALLHCILLDNLDLVHQLVRCFPQYPHNDYRFHEIVDAAIALNKSTFARYLMQVKPGSRCTARALQLAAKNGHTHIVNELYDIDTTCDNSEDKASDDDPTTPPQP